MRYKMRQRRRVSQLVVLVLMTVPSLTVTAADFDQAYRQQRDQQVSQLNGQRPFGFKAGLTSTASREAFGSDRSVAGVLRRGAEGDVTLALGDFGKGRVEMELAFQLTDRIDTPIADVAALRPLVARVAPALEFPDLALLGPGRPTALTIVRANVAAHRVVVGQGTVLGSGDLNSFSARLYRDDQLISEGRSDGVLGGQWQALLELINTMLAAGWTLHPDQWLLTGALDGMQVLASGHYRLNVEGLGEVSARVLTSPISAGADGN